MPRYFDNREAVVTSGGAVLGRTHAPLSASATESVALLETVKALR